MVLSENIRNQLLASFRVELKEHIRTMTDGLLALEQQKVSGEERQELLNHVFRAAHSLKGAARTVDATRVMQMAHALEDILDLLRRDAIEPTQELFTSCYQTLDAIQLAQSMDGPEAGSDPALDAVLKALAPFRIAQTGDASQETTTEGSDEALEEPDTPSTATVMPSDRDAGGDEDLAVTRSPVPLRQSVDRGAPNLQDETIRVQVGKLDALMAQLSELLLTKIRVEQRMSQLRDIEHRMEAWQDDWLGVRSTYARMVRRHTNHQEDGTSPAALAGAVSNATRAPTHMPTLSDIHRLDKDLSQILDYFELSQSQLQEVHALVNTLSREYTNDVLQMSLVIDELEGEIKRVRMLPLSTILAPFGRMVRDLAYESDKEAILNVVGAETELDKQVLEQIKDPLMHLLRNAVDHGIELPDERESQGKPRYGTITLAAEQAGQDVVIRVSDDGKGLDLPAIRQAVSRHQGHSPQDLDRLTLEQAIYDVGISTSPVITDVSGRGVGLDVVRRNVESLHGRIDMDWSPGEGTTFLLTLPLALSSTHGLLVRVADQPFAIPLNAIERMMEVDPEEVASLAGGDAIRYAGQLIPLVWMADTLGLPRKRELSQNSAIVILASAERRMAFVVDDLSGEQEIVNKGLGKQLVRVAGIAGATVLGSGEIVLVLNVADLIKMALRGERQAVIETETETGSSAIVRHQLLIVDDSITTRTLEKNILEAAGYRVEIATNGQEAWNLIASGELPDLVVSDVSMPRMTGIELTRRIKDDARTAQLPVILVTSLDSPQDKARGIEAGADAYITKGTFDQNSLLQTVKQLI
jgi:two-component system chemotaxis sensor kinase CheA